MIIARTLQVNNGSLHSLITCSYDNSVRLFDVRKPFVPIVKADVGGGAWRVKWHPSLARKHDLLVACMHDGFKVIRFGMDNLLDGEDQRTNIADDWEVLKRFDAHKSLAYGVDWSYESIVDETGTEEAETLIASGSFYDHSLHVWSG